MSNKDTVSTVKDLCDSCTCEDACLRMGCARDFTQSIPLYKLITKWDKELSDLVQERICETDFKYKNILSDREDLISQFIKDLKEYRV